MASVALELPILARVDLKGKLVHADAPLLTLQHEAGGRLGGDLALPQLAGLARLAARLGVMIERPAVVANATEDFDLWVRADPDPEGVTLAIERWAARPPARPRWPREAGSAPGESTEEAEDLVTDRELRVEKLSPSLARLLGVEPGEVVGQPFARIVRPVEDQDGNIPLLAALAGRAPFNDQPATLRGNDSIVLLDGRPRQDDDRFAGYAVRVRVPGPPATAPLIGLPLDDLLKDPLATIIGQAQEIAARSEGPLRSDYAGYGADIAAAARHLLELLASIGPDAQAAGSADAVIDLAELALDAAGFVQPQAAPRRILLDVGGAAHLPARGQARAVTQILVNLIGNAVRFSPEGGTVVITIELGGEQAAVTVGDSGPGVAIGDQERIFERFEQAGTKAGGAGLGLAISRRLAREMGGDVELLPTSTGATFRLRLPAA